MPLERLQLTIEWPGGREVPVEVVILPELDRSALRKAAPEEAEKGGPPIEEIGPEDTDSLATLHKFLARLTRSAGEGEVRRASCLKSRTERVLELLDIEGPPSKPISVPLPADE